MLEQADLARYARQFVWLDLNFDKAENHAFFAKYGAIATPTFYIVDPQDGQVGATQTGAMSLVEFKQFLDRGAGAVMAKTQTPADAALTEGDTLLAQKPAAAADAYRQALHLAPKTWSKHELAEASLVTALQDSEQFQACTQTAISSATAMKGNDMFARTVVAGMWCLVSSNSSPWFAAAGGELEPLAKQALSLPSIVQDHRNELYRTLMYFAVARNDKTSAAEWGNRWLHELDAIKPRNDEERSAVDIARVENVQAFGDPQRILPALISSERAMPDSWNASLRVAQMQSAAKDYGKAIAAVDRGLTRQPGPAGRSWLMRVKADALSAQGEPDAARHALEEALTAAQQIPNPQTRDNSVRTIRTALERSGKTDKN